MLSIIGHSNSCSNNNYNNNVNSPSNLVRSIYNDTQEYCNDNGRQATGKVCQKSASHDYDIRINANSSPYDDACFSRNPKGTHVRGQQNYEDSEEWGDDSEYTCQQNQKKESCLERRKKYSSRGRPKCTPVTGQLSEYQEAYRKPNIRAGPRRIYPRLLQKSEERPPWNSSMTIPAKPYQETLESAEAKLRALDTFMDPSHDEMALAIMREQVRERYRAKRNGVPGEFGGGVNNGGDCGSAAADSCAVLMRGGGGWHPKAGNVSCFPIKPAPDRRLELLEEEESVNSV